MAITKRELERRIMAAASVKRPEGTRGVGSIDRRKQGLAVRSRTFAEARNSLLREIGEDIVKEAKAIYTRLGLGGEGGDDKFLGHLEDPRTVAAQTSNYLNSFDVTPQPGGNRPSILIQNKARVTKADPYSGRKKTYKYGDVVEWGREALYQTKPKFKIGIQPSYAERKIRQKKDRRPGSKRPITRERLINPVTGSFISYDTVLENWYEYSSLVPEIKGRGIIAKAVDNVLGERAAALVRART